MRENWYLPEEVFPAVDESNGTMSNRLEAVGIEPSVEARRSYRTNLFSADGYESAISGVILFDETIRQSMDDGNQLLKNYQKEEFFQE